MGQAKGLTVLDAITLKEQFSITTGGNWMHSTGLFSPDGRLAISGGKDQLLRLWDVETGRPIRTLRGHTDTVRSVAFSPDGKGVVSAGEDGTLRLWDVATCLPLSSPLQHNSPVMSVAMNQAAPTALTGRLWHLPAPLPDVPPLVDLWVQLATERSFTAGENVEWLDPAALAAVSTKFEARAGKAWTEWAD